MADYPVGTSTMSYMFTHSARACLEHLAGKGFRLFELVIFPPHIWPTTLDEATKREIGAFVADRGLAITSLCYPLLDNNINSPVPEVRRFTIDMYKRVIDLAVGKKTYRGSYEELPDLPGLKDSLRGCARKALCG